MADPVVHITNGIPDSGTGNITTLGQLQAALLAVLPVALGTGGGLKIDGSGTAVPISGTLTANAGTNLNTSLLALESGNLASLVTALGAVTASPTANTIADRLKTINTTLSGNLTINSVAVTNVGTFAVQAAQSGVWNVTNISGTISLPTGAATAAKQPAIGSAGSSSTDVLSVQGIASGTALPVSAASLPLPTGAASAANQTNASAKSQIVDGSGNVIGATSNALDVNIKSGSGGTSSTFGATMPLAGTAAGLFDGTNMVRAKGDETNGLWVNIKAGAGSGGTAGTDEGTFTAGSSSFTPIGGFFQTTATSNPLTAGQWGALQLTVNRAAHVNLRSATGVALGVAGAALIVDGSAVTQPVSGTFWQTTQPVSGTFWQATQPISAASLPLPSGASTSAKQAALGTAGTASSDVLTVQGIASMTALKVDGSAVTQPVSGTFWQATQPVSASSLPLPTGAATSAKQPALGTAGSASADVLSIQGVASMTAIKVDGSGVTQPVSLSSTTITGTVAATQSGTWSVGSSSATGSAVPANAFAQGSLAKTALPTAVADGQLVGNMADKYGRQVVLQGAPRDLVGRQTTTLSATTSETTIVTAAASVFNDLAMLVVSNTDATTSCRVDFRDTTAGTVVFSLEAAAGQTQGFSLGVPVPQAAVNTNWTAQCSASVTDLRIFALYVKNK